MDWLALLAYILSIVITFFIGWRVADRARVGDLHPHSSPAFERLHDHVAKLEAALEDAGRGAPIQQTRRGLRVGAREIELMTGGGRLPSGGAAPNGDAYPERPG